MTPHTRRIATLAFTAAASVGLTLAVVHSVRAIGIPAAPSMYYRGTLEESGALVTGTRMFTVRLVTAAGVERCTTGSVTVAVTNGAFDIPLPMSCTEAIRNEMGTPDLYQELTLGTAPPLSRTRLGAVPFAVVAERATTAEPGGALSAAIAALGNDNPDCPSGYARDPALSTATVTVCSRPIAAGRDEVVKVGPGPRAFWVDRFEARVFDATGRQYGASDANYPNLASNGQWTAGARGTLLALSRAGGVPSAYVTWFQANALCAASGKSLMSREQWFLAADGLAAIDPATPLNGNVASVTGCNTGGTSARATGSGTTCASSWGVQDMIGNLQEWTAEWYAGVGQAGAMPGLVQSNVQNWPADYNADSTTNINGFVFTNPSGTTAGGIPSAAIRGGPYNGGVRAGVFTLHLDLAPTMWTGNIGFRCVVPGGIR